MRRNGVNFPGKSFQVMTVKRLSTRVQKLSRQSCPNHRAMRKTTFPVKKNIKLQRVPENPWTRFPLVNLSQSPKSSRADPPHSFGHSVPRNHAKRHHQAQIPISVTPNFVVVFSFWTHFTGSDFTDLTRFSPPPQCCQIHCRASMPSKIYKLLLLIEIIEKRIIINFFPFLAIKIYKKKWFRRAPEFRRAESEGANFGEM
jgi:hypothetical protein